MAERAGRLPFKTGMLFLMCSIGISGCADQPPAPDFVAVSGAGIELDIKYFTGDNLVGERLDGYLAPSCWLARSAANALQKVAVGLAEQGLGLLIFDCYRPQTAVNHFVRWAASPEDLSTKPLYYPNEEKARLFERGYIAERSGHSRGATVDLSVYRLADGKALDMGTGFDYMDESSATAYEPVSETVRANRDLLLAAMTAQGFVNYAQEWWHYTYKPEPYPDTYFSQPVSAAP